MCQQTVCVSSRWFVHICHDDKRDLRHVPTNPRVFCLPLELGMDDRFNRWQNCARKAQLVWRWWVCKEPPCFFRSLINVTKVLHQHRSHKQKKEMHCNGNQIIPTNVYKNHECFLQILNRGDWNVSSSAEHMIHSTEKKRPKATDYTCTWKYVSYHSLLLHIRCWDQKREPFIL